MNENKRGGSLGRSETVTVRINSLTKENAENAAKRDRRTLSNWIEVAIEKAVIKEWIGV